MQVGSISSQGATLILDDTEMMILNNALNELFSGARILPGELHSRVGASENDVRALLDAVHAAWTEVAKEREKAT